MMEAVKDLSEQEFVELLDLIYTMGYVDCGANYVRGSSVKSRQADLKCRIETWLEI